MKDRFANFIRLTQKPERKELVVVSNDWLLLVAFSQFDSVVNELTSFNLDATFDESKMKRLERQVAVQRAVVEKEEKRAEMEWNGMKWNGDGGLKPGEGINTYWGKEKHLQWQRNQYATYASNPENVAWNTANGKTIATFEEWQIRTGMERYLTPLRGRVAP
jgi:hypothetical protein